MVKNILFDFDGTLVDTRQGIINSMFYALEKLGIKGIQQSEIIGLIGKPLEDMFIKLLNVDCNNEVSKAVGYFRERYSIQGLLELSLYEGVEETLQHMMNRNISLYIATSKPQIFTRTICRNLDIEKYFNYICGVDLKGTSQNKTERVRRMLDFFKLKTSQTIMIGDRAEDIITAQANNLCSIGVLWGFGSREELINAGCDLLLDNFSDLKQLPVTK